MAGTEKIFGRTKKQKKVKTAHMKTKQVAMEDINPHFLFNALNSIKSEIYLKEENAYEHIDNIALYLRYVFSHSGEREVEGAEAVLFLENYMKLEQLRFEKIHFTKKVETTAFCIQPFLLVQLASFMLHESMLEKQGESTLHILINEEAGKTKIVLSDNGNGCNAEKWIEAKSKSGILGGNDRRKNGISVQGSNNTGGGTTFVIVIP